jgi:hypothetical protein
MEWNVCIYVWYVCYVNVMSVYLIQCSVTKSSTVKCSEMY